MKKINYIGIDIDSSDVFELLKRYILARKLFPDSEIITRISPSGHGYHMIIRLNKRITPFENFLYRALLDDDPYRLLLAMKKFAIDGERWYDLIFTHKYGNKSQELDLDRLLKNYDIEEIIKNWGEFGTMDKIEKISKGIKKKIGIKEVWMTCFAFKTNALREKLKGICEDISLKDESFKFKIYQNFQPEWDFILVIFSDSKDKAFQRGAWFLKNCLDEEDLGNVKKFGKDKYYWVKKRVEK